MISTRGGYCLLAILTLALALTANGATGQPADCDARSSAPPLLMAQAAEAAPLTTQTQAENSQVAQATQSGAPDSSTPDTAAQGTTGNSSPASPANQQPGTNATRLPNPEPKRILGIMPNFKAVSAGVMPPQPTAGEAFKIATRNSFDYSSFLFVGLTSLLAETTNTHAQFGKGVEGFGDYYWRGFADSVDGNYWVIFVLPTVFHQDERYYALGKGGFWKRLAYSASRVAITPNKDGNNSFNTSEILGRGIAQGVSTAYYPDQARTFNALAAKFAFSVLRDAATNSFREFWPDIAARVRHRHP